MCVLGSLKEKVVQEFHFYEATEPLSTGEAGMLLARRVSPGDS